MNSRAPLGYSPWTVQCLVFIKAVLSNSVQFSVVVYINTAASSGHHYTDAPIHHFVSVMRSVVNYWSRCTVCFVCCRVRPELEAIGAFMVFPLARFTRACRVSHTRPRAHTHACTHAQWSIRGSGVEHFSKCCCVVIQLWCPVTAKCGWSELVGQCDIRPASTHTHTHTHLRERSVCETDITDKR